MPFPCSATHNHRLVFPQPSGHGGYRATDAALPQHRSIFPYWQNRLRITFVQRMNKAQQYLLHHVLGITKFCAFNNTKWLGRVAQYALICNSSIQTRLRLMVWIPSYIDLGIRVSLLAGAISPRIFTASVSSFVDGFPDVGVRVSSVRMQIDRPDYTRSDFRQLNAPVDERPLWPDTGKQHCQ